MSEQTVQQRFKKLKDTQTNLGIRKAKAESNVEHYTKQQTELKVELKKLAKTDDIELAKAKRDKVEAKLNDMLNQAEAILNESAS
jgi:hypothetical protein